MQWKVAWLHCSVVVVSVSASPQLDPDEALDPAAEVIAYAADRALELAAP